MKKKPQQGISLIWVLIGGALLITGVEIVLFSRVREQIPFDLSATLEEVAQPENQPKPTPQPALTQEQIADLDKLIKNLDYTDKLPKITHEDIYGKEPLLKILPPKERAELESAINQAQEVLKNIEVYDSSAIDKITDPANWNLESINKQANEQIQKNIEKQKQEYQKKYYIDPKKIEDYFNENPPTVIDRQPGADEPSPEALEYYYYKEILKHPAFQW